MHFLAFSTIKILTLRMDHAKLLDVLMSLLISHAIVPRAVCFARSRPAIHALCSYTRLHSTIRFSIDNNVNILIPCSKTVNTKFTKLASF